MASTHSSCLPAYRDSTEESGEFLRDTDGYSYFSVAVVTSANVLIILQLVSRIKSIFL